MTSISSRRKKKKRSTAPPYYIPPSTATLIPSLNKAYAGAPILKGRTRTDPGRFISAPGYVSVPTRPPPVALGGGAGGSEQ